MHDTTGKLGKAEVELIHRVVADPGRLSEKWSASVLAMGLSEGEYVEIAGLIAMVTPIGVLGFLVALTGVLALIRSLSAVGSRVPRVKGARKPFGSRLQERWDRRTFE